MSIRPRGLLTHTQTRRMYHGPPSTKTQRVGSAFFLVCIFSVCWCWAIRSFWSAAFRRRWGLLRLWLASFLGMLFCLLGRGALVFLFVLASNLWLAHLQNKNSIPCGMQTHNLPIRCPTPLLSFDHTGCSSARQPAGGLESNGRPSRLPLSHGFSVCVQTSVSFARAGSA